MGSKGGSRGRGRAALVLLWAEAGLPELRQWQIAGWKDVVGIVAVDPALEMVTLWETLLTLVSGAEYFSCYLCSFIETMETPVKSTYMNWKADTHRLSAALSGMRYCWEQHLVP